MQTLINGKRESPVIATVMKDNSHLPIHKTVVVLHHLEQMFSFLLSYRFDRVFLRNKALRELNRNVVWWGDMLVCKMGVYDGYVNLNAGIDRRAATRAVR
jgi:hypothetical protein